MFDRNKYPKVIIVNKNIRNEIGKWLRYGGNVSKQFAKLLFKLGFKSNDEIVIYDFIPETFTIKYCVYSNEGYSYRNGAITLVNGRLESNKYKNPKIIHSFDNVRERYECVRNLNGNISNNIKLISYDRDISDNIMCRRNLFNDSTDILIEKDEYSIRIMASNIANIPVDSNDMYELDNELSLIDYLISLDFPVNIIDVYKKICEISLNDIDYYKNFSLVITKMDNLTGEDIITDMINLSFGKLENFVITKDGTKICIDKDDNWSCENFVNNTRFCVYYENKNEELCYDYEEIIRQLIDFKNIIEQDVDSVKKRVKTLFDKSKGSK